MILETTRGSANVPADAVQLTKEEALSHQKTLIEKWPSITDVFFLRFGRYITAASTFLCSAACINVFHPLLKFGRGTITAVLPSIALPTLLLYYKTDKIITNEILTLKMDCPLCYHLKFLVLQLYGGIVFPGLVGLLNTDLGQGVPLGKGDTREYWRKSFAIAQGRSSTFHKILFVQITLALIVPYFQHIEITKIMNHVNENPEATVKKEFF